MKPCIILVNPQMGENIGAAARAMLNFGLEDLRLVAPRDGWPNQRAVDMASGAFEKMPEVRVFESLQEAAADLHMLYATTARVRDMVKPVMTPAAAAQDAKARKDAGQRAGFVFGPERTGLENEDVMRCQAVITIPTNPAFSSLNLGQSVLLVASAAAQAGDDTPPTRLSYGDSEAVSQDKLEEFLARLEDALEGGGFFKAATLKPTMVKNIRAIFTRADLSDQEVKTLHGVVSSLIKPRNR